MASSSVISLGLQVEGEATLKSALRSVDEQIKALGSGMTAATAQMDAMGKSEELTAQKSKLAAEQVAAYDQKLAILREQLGTASGKLSELGAALERAKQSGDPAAIEKASIAYNNQSAAVAKLQTAVSTTEAAQAKAVTAMNQGAEAAKAEGTAFDSAATQTNSLEQNVAKMAQTMQLEFVAKAAKAAIDVGKQLVTAFIDAGKAIAGLLTDAGAFADEILTLSAQTGISTQKLQEWGYAGEFVDTSVDTIIGSLTKLTPKIGENCAAFDTLGIATKNADGSLRSAEDVFFDAIDALGKVQNATERDKLAMELFGKSAKELNPLIEAGSAEFKRLGQEAQAAGLIIGEESVEKLGAFDDATVRLNATVDSAKKNIAVAFADMGTEIANDCTDIVQAFVGTVKGVDGSANQLSERVGKLVQDVTKRLIDMLPTILKTGTDIIVSLVKGITENKQTLMNTIRTVITELIKAIVAMLPDIISMGVDLIIALVKGIIDALPQLAASAPQIIAAIVKGVMQLMGELPKLGVRLIEGLWEGIKGAIGWLWEKIKQALGSVFGWVLDLLGIHSPSKVMEKQVGLQLGLGTAKGILESAKYVQNAYKSFLPDTDAIMASADFTSVVSRTDNGGVLREMMLDNRPITIQLNDRELGRAVRGYA